jgi:hypothetical protein
MNSSGCSSSRYGIVAVGISRPALGTIVSKRPSSSCTSSRRMRLVRCSSRHWSGLKVPLSGSALTAVSNSVNVRSAAEMSYRVCGLGVLFTIQRDAFKHPISAYQATYFSFITITTVGYGDVVPRLDGSAASNLLQLSIVSEVVIGLYFLTVLIGGVVAWVSSPPPKPPMLAAVSLTPSANRGA